MPTRTARSACIRLSAYAMNRRETALRKTACFFISLVLVVSVRPSRPCEEIAERRRLDGREEVEGS